MICRCKCSEDWFGAQCGLKPPCEEIANSGFAEFNSAFMPLEHTPDVVTMVHGRPVYYSEAPGLGYYHLILYDGAAWRVTASNRLKQTNGVWVNDIGTLAQLHSAFSDFHIWTALTDEEYTYRSAETTSLGPDGILDWYRNTHKGLVWAPGAGLTCSSCTPLARGMCGLGTCSAETRKCVCNGTGYRGSRCNIAPADGQVKKMLFQAGTTCYSCPAQPSRTFGLNPAADKTQCAPLLDYKFTFSDDPATEMQLGVYIKTDTDFAITKYVSNACAADIKRVTLPTNVEKRKSVISEPST